MGEIECVSHSYLASKQENVGAFVGIFASNRSFWGHYVNVLRLLLTTWVGNLFGQLSILYSSESSECLGNDFFFCF